MVDLSNALKANGHAPVNDSLCILCACDVLVLGIPKMFPGGGLGVVDGKGAHRVRQSWIDVVLMFESSLDVLAYIQMFVVGEIHDWA